MSDTVCASLNRGIREAVRQTAARGTAEEAHGIPDTLTADLCASVEEIAGNAVCAALKEAIATRLHGVGRRDDDLPFHMTPEILNIPVKNRKLLRSGPVCHIKGASMSRILFGSLPSSGHYNPLIAIAQKLLARRHSVRFASHPALRSTFEKAGIPFIDSARWGEAIIRWNMQASGNNWRAWATQRTLLTAKVSFPFYKLEKEIKNCLDVMDEWKPDACVFDILFHPGSIAAEIRNIPFATSCPFVLQIPDKEFLPFVGLPSGRTQMNVKQLVRYKLLTSPLIKTYLRYINRSRARYKLPPLSLALSTFYVPYSPYLYLVYTTSALEVKRSDLPPYVYYIGSSVSGKRGDRALDFPWDWLEGDTPVVYFTMGTTWVRKKILTKAIRASTNAPWKLVVSISNLLKTEEWPDLPENVLLRNYVPQSELAKEIDAIVTIGGQNTVLDALSAGVPLVVIPQMGDQFDLAQQVVEAGAGLRLDPGQVSVRSLHEAISKVLNEPSYGQNAERISRDFAHCDGAETAATLISKLAETKRPLLRPDGVGPTIYSRDLQKIVDAL
ncbi:MAG: glycosyltransferase [Halobacteriota archaeon]